MLLPEQHTGPTKAAIFIAESNLVNNCVLICVDVTKVLSTGAFRRAVNCYYNNIYFSTAPFHYNELFQAVYTDSL